MNAFSAFSFSVLIGGVLGGGVLCIIAALPRWAAVTLTRRIAPYVRDVVSDADLPASVLPAARVLPSDGTSLRIRARTMFERAVGGREALQRRLAQAGSDMDAVTFRGRQLGWIVVGIGAGAIAVIVLVLTGRMTAPVSVLPLLAGAGAAVVYEMQLSARVGVRRGRLTDELPTTLEFLALCLAAGEGFLDSLRRVAAVGSGALTIELRAVVVAVGTGSSLADALSELSARLQLPGLTRAVDQVIAALEHGAPLAAVLHAQAGDAREDAKRVLIEQAGRKEILMLLPLVFLILPLSVLFAIYPGLFILRLGIG
ncbi:type II secretion system F family protein [Microbacterium sp. C5A9]|uniref:type II secretion system F family protein n=1 Tax=Microbacterium sp. C5A9 TaxID=2736663 RepID=UPI001F52388C|nr:type II secretion system F family protein [Microbacterium sp. C5A9]MCI1019374.1 type II secretion system F family protein [Microbacterium sp. C5A9]